jgi:hypothetical protein
VDLNELRKMTLPKLRELAKEATDLQGVGGMKKDELVEAIAKAKGIAFVPTKDLSTIISVKQQIRALKRQRDEILASSKDEIQIKRIRRKIKLLKRITRQLAAAAKVQKAQQPSAPAGAAPATA